MEITFFIGNGFDKALGLKTGYLDFYAWFKDQQINETYCQHLKNTIARGKKKNDLWRDLEVLLGRMTGRFVEEDDLEDFSPWKKKVDEYLMEYLNSQHTSEDVRGKIERENIIPLCFYFLHGGIFACNTLNSDLIGDDNREFKFHTITLNYTDSLDQIAQKLSALNTSWFQVDSEVLHPHGSLTSPNGIILGVNDRSQINNNMICEDKNYSKEISKPSLVVEKYNDVKNKAIEYFNQSQLICLYGVSLGETDKAWWKLLVKALKENKDKRLVIFWYNKTNKGSCPVADISCTICG